jgi:hypothetical protein
MPKNSKSGRPAIGDAVRITFLDHAENAHDAIRFKVYGEVREITKTAYNVVSWGYVNPLERAADSNTDNEVWFSIVKRAIESIEVLK